MSDNPRKPPNKKATGPLVTILVLVVIGIIYMGWNYLAGNLPWQQAEDDGKPKVTWLEKETFEKDTWERAETATPEEEKPAAIRMTPGDEQKAAPGNECLQTADKILLFFEHLDKQSYIRNYTIKGSTLEHFRGLVNKLIANPPVVVRETDDLFAILNNMAHLFRVLGPKDILLVKDILIHERELIEPTMALFYRWSEIADECRDTELGLELPLPGLYEYAGYFINTLGGQSYLFRRELFLRLLIRYYSILIIDRANSADANRYGIDIRYTLDSLIAEIQANIDLENRETYLENLVRLQEKYQAKYGSR